MNILLTYLILSKIIKSHRTMRQLIILWHCHIKLTSKSFFGTLAFPVFLFLETSFSLLNLDFFVLLLLLGCRLQRLQIIIPNVLNCRLPKHLLATLEILHGAANGKQNDEKSSEKSVPQRFEGLRATNTCAEMKPSYGLQ